MSTGMCHGYSSGDDDLKADLLNDPDLRGFGENQEGSIHMGMYGTVPPSQPASFHLFDNMETSRPDHNSMPPTETVQSLPNRTITKHKQVNMKLIDVGPEISESPPALTPGGGNVFVDAQVQRPFTEDDDTDKITRILHTSTRLVEDLPTATPLEPPSRPSDTGDIEPSENDSTPPSLPLPQARHIDQHQPIPWRQIVPQLVPFLSEDFTDRVGDPQDATLLCTPVDVIRLSSSDKDGPVLPLFNVHNANGNLLLCKCFVYTDFQAQVQTDTGRRRNAADRFQQFQAVRGGNDTLPDRDHIRSRRRSVQDMMKGWIGDDPSFASYHAFTYPRIYRAIYPSITSNKIKSTPCTLIPLSEVIRSEPFTFHPILGVNTLCHGSGPFAVFVLPSFLQRDSHRTYLSVHLHIRSTSAVEEELLFRAVSDDRKSDPSGPNWTQTSTPTNPSPWDNLSRENHVHVFDAEIRPLPPGVETPSASLRTPGDFVTVKRGKSKFVHVRCFAGESLPCAFHLDIMAGEHCISVYGLDVPLSSA